MEENKDLILILTLGKSLHPYPPDLDFYIQLSVQYTENHSSWSFYIMAKGQKTANAEINQIFFLKKSHNKYINSMQLYLYGFNRQYKNI